MIKTFIDSHLARVGALTLPRHTRTYAIGPLVLQVHYLSESLLNLFDPAFAQSSDKPPTHTLWALDAAATQTLSPPSRWCFPESIPGSLQRAYSEGGYHLATDDERFIWNLASGTQGLYWIKDAGSLPAWEQGGPFRLHINWFASQLEALLLHAAGLAPGLLLAGAGGSGKSTTTQAALDAGMQIIGEDFLLVHEQIAYPIYRTLKLGEKEAKACRYIPKERFEAHPVRAICSMEFADSTSLVPANGAEVLQALAPSSLFLLRTDYHQRFHALARLVQQLPCFHARLGPDPHEVVKTLIQEFSACQALV